MEIKEVKEDKQIINELIGLSQQWEKEEITIGYIHNDEKEFLNKRIFVASDDGVIVGYILGSEYQSKKKNSVIEESSSCFEIDELFVIKQYRGQAVGRKLFEYVENVINDEYDYITLSAVGNDAERVLNFYQKNAGMKIQSARMYKKMEKKHG